MSDFEVARCVHFKAILPQEVLDIDTEVVALDVEGPDNEIIIGTVDLMSKVGEAVAEARAIPPPRRTGQNLS